MSLPAAVLWDMDGTLVDTEPYWIAAEHAIVAEHGGTWSDEFAHQLVGNDLMVSAAFIRDHSPITWSPERIVDELLARVVAQVREHVPWRPGRPRAARGAAGRRCAQRAGDHVVALAGRCRGRGPARGSLRRGGDR